MSQSTAKVIGYASQNDGKDPFLNTIPINVIEHREVVLVPNYNLHYTNYCSWCSKGL